MKIDFATLAFGYRVKAGGNTPNWATALGQGKEHKINNDAAIDEILKGMIYSSVSLKNISTKIGKGGNVVSGDSSGSPIVMAAVFSKVYINRTLIDGGKFILIITRDTSKSHYGRLRLKYGPSNTFDNHDTCFSNSDFFALVRRQLSLAEDACWFVSDMSIANQDTLILKTTIVNPDGMVEYVDSAELHSSWKAEELVETARNTGGDNILLYGVPGAGKSHYIDHTICQDVSDEFKERVVFHPDYTYSDFVGQIMPENNDGKISYPFKPGPFTRILTKAQEDKNNNYYLIIEEINRGNAPAIFGDIFQSLDRDINGTSKYGITNSDIASEVLGAYYKDEKVYIPSNLYILATMNTADQNVFTLDTAFKRRWTMKSIPNNISECEHHDKSICGTPITWGFFAKTINSKIIEFGADNLSSEDNRLGAYFISGNELDNSEIFGEKVLMYLWNDAFKYNRPEIFKSDYRTLEELLEGFKTLKFRVFLESLGFSNDLMNKADSNLSEEEYLNNKKEEQVNLYIAIRDKIKEKVPNLYSYTTKSKQYIGIGSDNCLKKSFAEAMFKSSNIISFEIEKPFNEELLPLGTEIEYNGSHDHYFKIDVDIDSDLDDIVEAILNSYEQLKKDN